MRLLIAVALGLVACSGSDRSRAPAARTASSTPAAPRGPDALMLRVPRVGGIPRVTAFPKLDSTVWTGTDALPAIDRVLAFDAEEGLIAAVDARGLPLWLDLRLGSVTKTGREKPRGLISVDGSAIYGVGADGVVARFTPTGNWTFKPPRPASAAFPQVNGSLLVLTGRGNSARLIRIRPPEPQITDSLALPDATTGTEAPLGDRIYAVGGGGRTLTAIRARTLDAAAPIKLDHAVRAVAATPSGDRFYAITDSSTSLHVVDPLQQRVTAEVTLPGRPRDLRVDPFGRYVLVRSASGDAVWVVSIGTETVVSTLHSTWRSDLPFVAPDGTIAITSDADVVFTDAASGSEVRRAADGASEFWYAFVWRGLRPRAETLDRPAQFATDTDTVPQSTVPPAPPKVDSATVRQPPAPTPAPDSTKTGFTVSFAVLLNATQARDLAAKIIVDGKAARVVTSVNEGTAVYRVILGPYPTRDDAERVGRSSGHSFYVYAGAP